MAFPAQYCFSLRVWRVDMPERTMLQILVVNWMASLAPGYFADMTVETLMTISARNIGPRTNTCASGWARRNYL